MAYVLSLQPHSPLKRSFSDTPYLQSCSSVSLLTSRGNIKHNAGRNISTGSLNSGSSLHELHRGNNENASPRYASPASSKLLLDVRDSPHSCRSATASNRTIIRSPHVRSIKSTSPANSPSPSHEDASVEHLAPSARELTPEITIEHIAQHHGDAQPSSVHGEEKRPVNLEPAGEGQLLRPPGTWPTLKEQPVPFRRWVDSLRKRNVGRRAAAVESSRPLQDRSELSPSAAARSPPRGVDYPGHRKSESYSSSTGFITAIKSASVTLATASFSQSRRRSSRNWIEQRDSGGSEARASFDSHAQSMVPILDEATWLRSIQRRKILEEIITTEESYTSDIRTFVNVYLTLLASVAAIDVHLRASVKHTVTQMVQLHEDLLVELRKAIPYADRASEATSNSDTSRRPRHTRWHSADVATPRSDVRKSARKLRHSFEIDRSKGGIQSDITAEPSHAAEVAKIYNRFMRRFLIYESWAAQSESMHTAVISTYRTVPTAVAIERGLEILANVEGSINNKSSQTRKGLTLLDLLIKPIQRVCKYPLLFESLCKQTPACDDPVAHDEIQRVLLRLREMTDEVNKATDNPHTRHLVEATWALQDRLVFEDDIGIGSPPTVIFHLLGRVILCGVLHVAYETKHGVKGQFTLCVLYRSCLLLATISRDISKYSVIGIIPLLNGDIRLQCHTAPHTWKLSFESSGRLCEVMLSACSLVEEHVWKTELQTRITAENHDFSEGRATNNILFCCAPSDLQSVASAFGHPESLARRISLRRAATLGPGEIPTRQVIIKNTQAQRQSVEPYSSDSVPTCSLANVSMAHVPTLAPRRAERVRLETILSDVWTKDVIPYPGILSRRPENPIRSSASSMMRKLSMASIASNFSKRSVSFASTGNSSAYTSAVSRDGSHSRASTRSRGRKPSDSAHPTWPRKVDFQHAPDAFLPRDFELQQRRPWCTRTESEGGVKSPTSCATGPNAACSMGTRPRTPLLDRGQPMLRASQPVAGLFGTPPDKGARRPSTASGVGVLSPKKERNRLSKLVRSAEATRTSPVRQVATKQASELRQSHDITNRTSPTVEGLEIVKESAVGVKKPSKMRSMLFKLWSG